MVFLRSVLRLLVIANVVPSSPILVILMRETLRSSKTSFLTRATRHHIQEDGILDMKQSNSNCGICVKQYYRL
jgi:hypothetical protein